MNSVERDTLNSKINFLKMQVEELKARVDPEKDALIKQRDMWANTATEQRKEIVKLKEYVAFIERHIPGEDLDEIQRRYNNPDWD
jgi:hypothetical protein